MNRAAHGIQTHPEAWKAFLVSDEWGDNGMVIVWARSYFEAKRVGACGLDQEYDDVTCERFRKLDGFTGDLLGFLIDYGWSFECSQCESRCYQDELLRVGDDLFCNEECHAKYEAYWAPKRALEQAFLRFAEVKFFGMQDVTFAYVNVADEAMFYDNHKGRYRFLLTISRAELGL